METVLTVTNLRKTFVTREKNAAGRTGLLRDFFAPHYRTVNAVDDVSFSVVRGEMLAFIGPNGAGKSTTIKCITGILYPTSGSITVLGMDPHKKRTALAYRIGTVFGQRSQLWFHLPPIDSLALLGDIYEIDRREARRRIDFLTETFEIGPYLHTPVRKLSLGERIRCEIAASLLHEPEILFLDEPTIGLDVVVRQTIRDLIKRINEEKKTTIFLTSHDAGDIEKICRRVIVINDGRIAWDDTVKTMKYSFLRTKVIDLKLDAPLRFSLAGVKVLKEKGYAAKLEVDLDAVALEKVVPLIMKNNRVQRITISNPPMEQIIAAIYGGRHGAAADGGRKAATMHKKAAAGLKKDPKGGRQNATRSGRQNATRSGRP